MLKDHLHWRDRLENLYERYNRRDYVHPDPLEFLYDYPAVQDREIVGLLASSLAYGRVSQILRSVAKVLTKMGKVAQFVQTASQQDIEETFADFKHRFTTGRELASLLVGVKHVLEEHGSLHRCFLEGMKQEAQTVLEAEMAFSTILSSKSGIRRSSLLPLPRGKSACKRLNLYLRWMVRSDRVDPGGWSEIPKSKLIIPLDTHMHQIALKMRFTKRKQADARTALEITEAFRTVSPHDTAKYDFALTRLGIRRNIDEDLCRLHTQWGKNDQ